MQVYRDLRVLTARPSDEEEAQAPHRLYGYADAAENLSVARWMAAADVAGRDRSGGTPPDRDRRHGALLPRADGRPVEHPAVPDDVRAALRAATADVPAETLHRELAIRDPETAATLRPTDKQRILRAMEVFEATGRPLVSFHGDREGRVFEAQECLRVFLSPERDLVYSKIDSRFDAMLSLGALEEVRALAGATWTPRFPSCGGMGCPG